MSGFAQLDKSRLLSYFLFEFLYFFFFLSYRFSIPLIYCVQCFLHSLLFLTLPLLRCCYFFRLHLFCLSFCLFILKMSSLLFLFLFFIFLSFYSLSFTSRTLSHNATFFLSFFQLFSAWNSSSHFFHRWFHSYDHHVTNLFSISLTNAYCSSTLSWC